MTSSIYIPRAEDSSSDSAGSHSTSKLTALPTSSPVPPHLLPLFSLPFPPLTLSADPPPLLPSPPGPSEPSLPLTSKFHRGEVDPHAALGLTKQIFLPPPEGWNQFSWCLTRSSCSSLCLTLLQTGFILAAFHGVFLILVSSYGFNSQLQSPKTA